MSDKQQKEIDDLKNSVRLLELNVEILSKLIHQLQCKIAPKTTNAFGDPISPYLPKGLPRTTGGAE